MSHYPYAWVGGALLRVPALLIFLIYSCIFYTLIRMNKNYFAPGSNYYDHHRDITINVNGANPADLLRAALAEDIEPVQTEKETPSDLPFLVVSKLQELNLYSLQEFEGRYRKAVRSDAKTLASFIKKYSKLEVLDIKERNKKQIFEELKAYFGAELDFGYPNFAAYY